MKQLCLFAFAFALSLFAAPPREVRGYVVDSQTGAPIARARVSATFMVANGPVTVQLLTDDTGAFLLRNAPEGDCTVVGQRPGYLHSGPVRSLARPSSSDTKDATLTIRLTPQAVVELTVEDEAGVPVRRANVLLFHHTIVEGHRLPQESTVLQTDDAGTARFFGLSNGHYILEVRASAGIAKGVKMAYPQVFYPNSPDIQGAERINLEAGQELHLRVRLPRPVVSRELRGQVAPAGESVELHLRRPGDTLYIPPLSVDTHWDPKTNIFKVSGVTPGIYVLEVDSYVANQQSHDWLQITVSERDIGGILLQPHASPETFGTITFEGPGTENVGGRALAVSSSRGQFSLGAPENGHFKSNAVSEGLYQLLPPGGPVYIRSAWQGGRDILRDGLVVSAEVTPAPLEIVLSGPGGTIEGRVSVPDSAENADLMVALLRGSGDRMVLVKEDLLFGSLPEGAVMLVSRTVLHGGKSFSIEGVGPGDYLLYCWRADSPMAYADPDFVEQYGSLGKAITVTGTEKVSVKLENILPRMFP